MRNLLFFASIIIALFFTGCTSSLDDNSKSIYSHNGNSDNNTVTIILSKENGSRTYRDFIERLDSTTNWRWVNAYGISRDSLKFELENAKGIILTGGVDIHPSTYGATADTIRCGTIDTYRDEIEETLLDHIDNSSIPCLGVCRGLQIMNVHAGGSLHPHLPDTLSEIHRDDFHSTTHDIIVVKSLGVFDIPNQTKSNTVSSHHQGIARLGSNLEAWAVAPDGLIEGIRRTDTINFPYYIGVQWHPERSQQGTILADPIGFSFINAALNYHH